MTMTPKTDSVAVLRELVARLREDDRNYADPAADYVIAMKHRIADEIDAALSAQGGEPATYGIRRNGETAIIGIVPEKIHRLPPTSGEYARDYEEVPLYLHPAPPGSDAVTEEEISWLAMEAASFIDNEYQHGRARPNAHRIREHLRAALAARTGKREANGR